METRTFTRDELLDLDLPGDPSGDPPTEDRAQVIADDYVDQRRWVTVYRLVFRVLGQPDDEAYSTFYEVGSTEYQENPPWDGYKTIECKVVRRTTKTIEVWE